MGQSIKKEKVIGIISYNRYCNFTNYGSALQSWALNRVVDVIGAGKWTSLFVNYCPDILLDKHPLTPLKNMWDKDEESRMLLSLSMPAIEKNYYKFEQFYNTRFTQTKKKYTSENFHTIVEEENISGFICGSDTIFCIDEFNGFDDGYYAQYACMKNGYTIAYAASFGDSHFKDEDYPILNQRLGNFKAIGLRENQMLSYVKDHVAVPVERVVDPTLLLTAADFDQIAEKQLEQEPYLLLYSRRYNVKMQQFAETMAKQHGWKIIEISLRAVNADKHRMMYDAGVEEFLSLVKYAQMVVTNSFHGLIFSVQYRRPFYVFSREQCDTKIDEVLRLFGLQDRFLVDMPTQDRISLNIDYEAVHSNIAAARASSLTFLKQALLPLADT